MDFVFEPGSFPPNISLHTYKYSKTWKNPKTFLDIVIKECSTCNLLSKNVSILTLEAIDTARSQAVSRGRIRIRTRSSWLQQWTVMKRPRNRHRDIWGPEASSELSRGVLVLLMSQDNERSGLVASPLLWGCGQLDWVGWTAVYIMWPGP